MLDDNVTAEWYSLAKMDSDSAHFLYNNQWPRPLPVICFLTQQSVEKLLKGFLTESEIEPPRTHDLPSLNEMCVSVNNDFCTLDDPLSYLSPFAVQPRYPNTREITDGDALLALKYMDNVEGFFKNHIGHYEPIMREILEQEKQNTKQERG